MEEIVVTSTLYADYEQLVRYDYEQLVRRLRTTWTLIMSNLYADYEQLSNLCIDYMQIVR